MVQAPNLAAPRLGDPWTLCSCLALLGPLWTFPPRAGFGEEKGKTSSTPVAPHLLTPVQAVGQAAEKPAVNLPRHLLAICLIAERSRINYVSR